MRLEISDREGPDIGERDGAVEIHVSSALGAHLGILIPGGTLLGIVGFGLHGMGSTDELPSALIFLGITLLVIGLWAMWTGTQVIRVKLGLLAVKRGPLRNERHYEAHRITDLAVIDRPPEHRRAVTHMMEPLPSSRITCLYDGELQTIADGLSADQAHKIRDAIERTLRR